MKQVASFLRLIGYETYGLLTKYVTQINLLRLVFDNFVNILNEHLDPSPNEVGERKREMFYLTTHSTHFIYGYMASDIWLRTILIVRKETRCRHIGYSYRLEARVLLYAPSH